MAVQDLAAFMVMEHVALEPQEEQASPQPAKLEPVSAVAVRVTEVLAVYGSVQSLPQLMPVGSLVTVPLPLPDLVTVRVFALVVSSSAPMSQAGP